MRWGTAVLPRLEPAEDPGAPEDIARRAGYNRFNPQFHGPPLHTRRRPGADWVETGWGQGAVREPAYPWR
jgi:hypothetical protein